MRMKRRTSILCITAAALSVSGLLAQPQPRRVTVEDLMKMRAIVDARISPDGSRVAYVVSTPNLVKNEHDASLFLVPAGGGPAVRIGDSVQIFNVPVPAPRLRWSPDGTRVGVLGLVNGRPQVTAIPIDGSAPHALTTAAEGVFGFEWSPDGSRLAYLTRD